MKVQRLLVNLFTTILITATAIQPAIAQDGILKAKDPQAQINLRQAPDPNSRKLGYGIVGDRVEILEQVPGADGYTWYRVRFYRSRAVGWIRNDFVQLASSPANPGPVSGEALYQEGYSQGWQGGYRDGQNARRYNSGNHPDQFLQAGSGNPDPNFDKGYRDGFYVGFASGYSSTSTPPPTTPPPANATVLTFQTSTNAVRIFRRSGQTLMNVFDKRDGKTWLNGVPVTVEQNQAGTYYRYQGEVAVVVFQGNDGTRTLKINDKQETGY